MKSYYVTIQIKATEQFFAVVLFSRLFKIILTSESVSQILKSDHSDEVSENYFPVEVFSMLYRSIYPAIRRSFFLLLLYLSA